MLKGYQKIESSDEIVKSSFSVSSDIESNESIQDISKQTTMGSKIIFIIAPVVMIAFYLALTAGGSLDVPVLTNTNSVSMFDDDGRYILRNYDTAKPMSNFLAGVGGLWGFPLWCFYVNRGQGVTSFGVGNKDNAISKFKTAEKAYQTTSLTGFRTFIRGVRNGQSFVNEPFQPSFGSEVTGAPAPDYVRNMMIGMNEMEIEEINQDLSLQTNVLYFSPPNQDFPSLVRKTTFTNLDAASPLSLDVLDGLARLLPSGLSDYSVDAMGRTMEAWMNVYNIPGSNATLPFFHISQGTADTPQVTLVNDGHFVISYVDSDDATTPSQPLPIIVDPTVVFGTDTQFLSPREFFKTGRLLEKFMDSKQCTTSRTPSSYAGVHLDIPAGVSVTVTSVYGHAANLQTLTDVVAPMVLAPQYSSKKRDEARNLANFITKSVDADTSLPIFNAYVQQNYLDNVLRGGVPIPLGDPSHPKIYHTFSRIHGDIERDYNWFQIDPTYFSQGPGNFRDVNQNRRLDVLLNPTVGSFNIRMFLSFVQADGYNPLTVATTNFIISDTTVASSVVASVGITDPQQKTSMMYLLTKAFRPGQLFNDMKTAGIQYTVARTDLLRIVLSSATQVFAAKYAFPSQMAFWADHWTYTLDLVENFVAVYPDQEQHMLFDSEPIPFFISPAVVKPRTGRYSVVDNPDAPGTGILRAYSPVSNWGDADFPQGRTNAMNAVWTSPLFVEDASGAGGAWHPSQSGQAITVSVAAKLSILAILKFSTVDPFGMGVEYEGGKPGWNDAMNGLPGLLGSGMPETYEMLRLVRYLRTALISYKRDLAFPSEFIPFLFAVSNNLDVYNNSSKTQADDFNYWDSNNNARESYRAATVGLFQGTMESVSADVLISLFDAIDTKTTAGIAKALAVNNGLSPTYFYYDCTDYEILPPASGSTSSSTAIQQVRALSFVQRTLPNFLEGPVRHLKVVTDQVQRQQIFQLTKASAIYDSKLQMFAICESLASMGQSIGRMKAFSPGWLENQSIWLHMSYKFYLELLRGGLYDIFFAEIKTGLVPFMNNTQYGRSPVEASSFIASSAFPDPKIHGEGFLARLSGSTAEFLSMWALIFVGPQPFALNADGNLILQLEPKLPGWMFSDDGLAGFTFLGSIAVTYHNPSKQNTWLISPTRIVVSDGETAITVSGSVVNNELRLVERIRNREVKQIDVFY